MTLAWERQGRGNGRSLSSYLCCGLDCLSVATEHQVRTLALPQFHSILLAVRELFSQQRLDCLASIGGSYRIACEDQLRHLRKDARRRGLLAIFVFYNDVLDRVACEVEDLEMWQSRLSRVEVEACELVLLQQDDLELR